MLKTSFFASLLSDLSGVLPLNPDVFFAGRKKGMNKNKFCYYNIDDIELDYIKELQIEYGFKNLSAYIRASLFNEELYIERYDQPKLCKEKKERKFRLTEEDLDQVRSDSKFYGTTITDYIYKRITKRRVKKEIVFYDERIGKVKKLIGILKQHYLKTNRFTKVTDWQIKHLYKCILDKSYMMLNFENIDALIKKMIYEIDNKKDTFSTLSAIKKEIRKTI